MSCNLWIENPPPLKQALHGDGTTLKTVPMQAGEDIVKLFLQANFNIEGFHHADIDQFEYDGEALQKKIPLSRHDSFKYANYIKKRFAEQCSVVAPHRVVVYQSAKDQYDEFKWLWDHGIKRVILVGKPHANPPSGIEYCTSVEKVLKYLSLNKEFDFSLGVIGIHTRKNEANRISQKFIAAGNKLFVMGQFLDDLQPMLTFMDELAATFEKKHLDLEKLQWNVGLSMFGLETRDFHAKLLRKKQLACEKLFRNLKTSDCRISQSIAMNMGFVEELNKRAKEIGLNIGYSIQPVIERYANGHIHPSTLGAVKLARYVSSTLA